MVQMHILDMQNSNNIHTMKKYLSILFFQLLMAIMLFAPIDAMAQADIITLINDQKVVIENVKAKALAKDRTRLSSPAEHKLLFVGCTNLSYGTESFIMDEQQKQFFRDVVANFKEVVELYADYNIVIQPEIIFIDRHITLSGSPTEVSQALIQSELDLYAPVGVYDAVLVSGSTDHPAIHLGVKTAGYENSYGYCWFKLLAPTGNATPPASFPYTMPTASQAPFLSTNIAIHEWGHMFEFLEGLLDIPFPPVHAYQGSPYGFTGYIQYPNDPVWDYAVYYRDWLSGNVSYTSGGNTQKIGMFPEMWKLTARYLRGEKVYIKNSGNGLYLTYTSDNSTSFSATPCPWYIKYSGNDRIMIFNEQGLTLDINNAWNVEGNTVKLFGVNGGYPEAQNWRISKNSDNTYKLTTTFESNNRVLQRNVGTEGTSINTDNNGINQKWIIEVQSQSLSALISEAESKIETDYTIPSFTELKRQLKFAKNNLSLPESFTQLETALNNLKAKDMPYNIVMNIYKDPTSQMAFNWYTNLGITGGKVQIAEGKITDPATFIPSKTFEAICIPINDLMYNNEPVNKLNEVANVAVNARRSYAENKVYATSLTPGTDYSFRVGKEGAWSEIGTFTTAKAGKDAFSFIYTTDPQASNYDKVEVSRLVTHIAFNKHPNVSFWLSCGDMADSNQSGVYSEWEWEQFFESQQETFFHKPFAPVQGNHDVSSSKRFRSHFNTEAVGFDDLNASSPGSAYSYVYGDALFLALNFEDCYTSGYLESLARWMRQEVAKYPNTKWRIVYYHSPLYTGGGHQDDAEAPILREKIAPVFDELKIDLALQGHDHIYEVIGPVNNKRLVSGAATGQEAVAVQWFGNMTGKRGGIYNTQEGTLYFLNGTSGTEIYPPKPLIFMGAPDFNNYSGLFTGRLGRINNPTYSHVTVYADSIVISTYEAYKNNQGDLCNDLYDKIKVVKGSSSTNNPYIWKGTEDTNWNNSANWQEGIVPTASDVATISGSAPRFPILTGPVTVAELHFEPGAQLGKQEFMTTKAYVQYDLNQRNRYHMLSIPLVQVYPGDFSFGGYPQTWVRTFSSNVTGSSTFASGNWATLRATNVPFTLGDGFMISLNEDNNPNSPVDGSSKGLRLLNNIHEVPFFDSPLAGSIHHAHDYSGGISTFYNFQFNAGTQKYDRIPAQSYTVPRTGAAFELAGSSSISKALDFADGTFAIVGNPYMSALDFNALCNANAGAIKPTYQVWTGNRYDSYSAVLDPVFIAPLQGFLVEKPSTPSSTTLTFLSSMASAQPGISLRSAASEENRLDVVANNSIAEVRTTIAKREFGQDTFGDFDARKIMNEISEVPEIYTLKPYGNGVIAVGVNIINNDNLIIPLGLATSYSGKITFTLSGMDTYNANLSLIDVVANKDIDITGLDLYDYTFNYTPTAAACEDRFFIKISDAITGDLIAQQDAVFIFTKGNQLQVLSCSAIGEIQVFDTQGRVILKETNMESLIYSHDLPRNSIFIVKVLTGKDTIVKKVITGN